MNWFVVYFDFNPKSYPRLHPERHVPLLSPPVRTEQDLVLKYLYSLVLVGEFRKENKDILSVIYFPVISPVHCTFLLISEALC